MNWIINFLSEMGMFVLRHPGWSAIIAFAVIAIISGLIIYWKNK